MITVGACVRTHFKQSHIFNELGLSSGRWLGRGVNPLRVFIVKHMRSCIASLVAGLMKNLFARARADSN